MHTNPFHDSLTTEHEESKCVLCTDLQQKNKETASITQKNSTHLRSKETEIFRGFPYGVILNSITENCFKSRMASQSLNVKGATWFPITCRSTTMKNLMKT